MKLTCQGCGKTVSIACVEGEQCLVKRLQALGVRPGASIQVLRKAPFGGPLHVRVGSTEFFMRPHEASSISVLAC